MNEKQALIMLKDEKVDRDIGNAFLSEDKSFYECGIDYFQYLGSTSEEFNGIKIKFNLQLA
jgi:hypothetical protein